MYNAFTKYEKDFNDWILEGYCLGVKDETREFIEKADKYCKARKMSFKIISKYQ